MDANKRRKVMQSIHSSDTKIEVSLRKALWHKGYRYRKNYTCLPGKPDIAITKYKIAIFCDSEFFHGKDWDTILKARLMKGKNPDYWVPKIIRNMQRDIDNERALKGKGWTVIRFWGNEIEKNLGDCVKAVEEAIFESKIHADE